MPRWQPAANTDRLLTEPPAAGRVTLYTTSVHESITCTTYNSKHKMLPWKSTTWKEERCPPALFQLDTFVFTLLHYQGKICCSNTELQYWNTENLFKYFIICPIAIAYSMGQIIKSVCICQSVSLRALSRSHFLIDIHQNWHRRNNPQKEEWVR